MNVPIKVLPLPEMPRPRTSAVEDLISGSRPALGEIVSCAGYGSAEIAKRIGYAEGFLHACCEHGSRLRTAMQTMADDKIARNVLLLVSWWPNAPSGDLAAYGAQLLEDVIDRAPSNYAISEAFKKLRQTSKFLPSIAEVLEELDAAQARVASTAYRVQNLPKYIEEAREHLARAERSEAAEERREAAYQARHGADGNGWH